MGSYKLEELYELPLRLFDALFEYSVEKNHAGTKYENGKFYTNGGRVLGVTAKADTLDEALAKAYSAVKKISFVNTCRLNSHSPSAGLQNCSNEGIISRHFTR